MTDPVVFDRVAEVYDATRGFPPEVEPAIVAAFARAFGPLAGLRVVEPGVGTGRVALPLLRAGADMRGVDLSEGMLARLGAKAGPGWEERFTLGDATALPYPDGSLALPGRARDWYTDRTGSVVEHLLQSGATVSKLEAARWHGREPVSELLRRIRDRTYSWQWPLDDDQQRRAVTAAETWCREQGAIASWEVRLALYVARSG